MVAAARCLVRQGGVVLKGLDVPPCEVTCNYEPALSLLAHAFAMVMSDSLSPRCQTLHLTLLGNATVRGIAATTSNFPELARLSVTMGGTQDTLGKEQVSVCFS